MRSRQSPSDGIIVVLELPPPPRPPLPSMDASRATRRSHTSSATAQPRGAASAREVPAPAVSVCDSDSDANAHADADTNTGRVLLTTMEQDGSSCAGSARPARVLVCLPLLRRRPSRRPGVPSSSLCASKPARRRTRRVLPLMDLLAGTDRRIVGANVRCAHRMVAIHLILLVPVLALAHNPPRTVVGRTATARVEARRHVRTPRAHRRRRVTWSGLVVDGFQSVEETSRNHVYHAIPHSAERDILLIRRRVRNDHPHPPCDVNPPAGMQLIRYPAVATTQECRHTPRWSTCLCT